MPVPSMDEFFPPAIAFDGTIFEFNRISLVRIVATVVLCVIFLLASRKLELVPRRKGQNMAEMALDFVRVNIAEEVLGTPARARPYVPMLTTMFFAILAMNITGVIPLLNISSTSLVSTPLILAIVSWIAFVVAGIRSHGAVGYFRAALFPAGVPWPIYIILTPIELLSTFIIRPITLTIRLMANMIAGHLLLVVFFGMTNYLLIQASGAMKALSVVSFAAAFAFTAFEIFVAVLQAYIFTLLTTVYISLAKEEH